MENEPRSLVEKLGELDEEEKAQLAAWAASNHAELWLQHHRKMFELKVASAIVLAPVVVFVVDYIRSVFTHTPMDSGLLTLLSGVFGAAVVQFFLRLAETKKAKKEADKYADSVFSVGRSLFDALRKPRGGGR